jgi:hypothetical protein
MVRGSVVTAILRRVVISSSPSARELCTVIPFSGRLPRSPITSTSRPSFTGSPHSRAADR